MRTHESRTPHTLQTVDRALSFLEFVSTSNEPPTVKQVAAALDVNLTTSYHLLRTLVARGYLERDDEGRLRLGGAVGTLSHAYLNGLNVRGDLALLVRHINDDTNETAFLSTLDGQSVILKELVEGTQPLRVGGLTVGYAGPELKRASGRAVLAFLSDDPRDEIVLRNLQAMPPDERRLAQRTLEQELRRTRQRGWAIDDETSEAGVTGIAAPVFGPNRGVYGAIGLVAPTTRATESHDRYVAIVVATAQQATQLLGGAPPDNSPHDPAPRGPDR
ncbi:MAG: IclR family transcriptional regulator [Actinomycetota bacterium]